ncbi:thioesterase family protein [Acidiferrimicrobium sp. IK]|uniref:thioesterase family protein n=1 Tax=Acidiferrimicrobium sp. IK TaxID=2871700 RepID=UPI0021CB1461|nr:thioesterase family protein [Acidiferrimicrobium sp. IK]MCU4185874.1 thioesterase family protein [Acidiferrimicrobium sp. IK]
MTSPAKGDAGESAFLTDTTVTRVDERTWTADVNPRWNIGNNPNGGYLLAIAVRAMQEAAGRPDPLSTTAHYLSPPTAGPVTVEVDMVKPGRSYVNVTARVVQDGRERVRLLGVLGDLEAQKGPTRVAARPPVLPDPDQCVSMRELSEAAGRPVPQIMDRFDLMLPRDTTWGRVPEDDPLSVTGWIRFRDGTQPDQRSLVTFADAFPPTLIGSIAAGWVPTLELTVHVRARPAPGWMLGTFVTRFLMDGLLEEDGELWDSSGRPVALSRQLALVLDRA